MKTMTKKSLEEALAGESQAHVKYSAFAEVAEKEGYPEVARLFRAIAYAEFVHAKNHAIALGLIRKTAENLQRAIEGEDFEVEEMYPAYAEIAKLQREKKAQRSIHYAVEAEKIHRDMYREALEILQQGKDRKQESIYICPVCGFTHIGEPPETCPVCNIKSSRFVRF